MEILLLLTIILTNTVIILFLQIPVPYYFLESVIITTEAVSSIPAHGEVYSL